MFVKHPAHILAARYPSAESVSKVWKVGICLTDTLNASGLARATVGEERARLWAKVRDYSGYGDSVDAYATLRSSETAVVVLEPRPDSGP
jgi:hypothetical protein